MSNERRVIVHHDRQALTGAVAARFITKVVDLLDEKPEVNIVLTGGTVGIGVLEAINASPARDTIDWSRVHLWWGDERWLPSGDAERNDEQARGALLEHVALREENIHRFAAADGALDLDAAAAAYESELASAGGENGLPLFDILFLGVGPDGHIASLFPGLEGMRVTDRPVVSVRNSPKPPPERLSLTIGTINSADRIWLVMAGTDKASALGLALAGVSVFEVPAAAAEGRKRTVFFVDQDAAAEVPEDLIATDY
ncbi:6-phosphogluconolactonase [Parafrigoribacterium soli]|uniref:6-phosphogluconolactonase n=1 Tax=Parafrigoribacterium soli TaxID=3144663 RepID=UPI0032EC0571